MLFRASGFDVNEAVTVFIIILNVTALGHTASIVPDQPRFRVAYASEAECRRDIPAVRRAVPIPALATLNAIECRKLEVRK